MNDHTSPWGIVCPKRTPQEAFDHVYRFIMAQGPSSGDEGFTCYYQMENGKRCAAGCLVGPNEEIGNLNICGTASDVYSRKLVDWNTDMYLVTAMQNAHDRASRNRHLADFTYLFHKAMLRISKYLGLTMPVRETSK